MLTSWVKKWTEKWPLSSVTQRPLVSLTRMTLLRGGTESIIRVDLRNNKSRSRHRQLLDLAIQKGKKWDVC